MKLSGTGIDFGPFVPVPFSEGKFEIFDEENLVKDLLEWDEQDDQVRIVEFKLESTDSDSLQIPKLGEYHYKIRGRFEERAILSLSKACGIVAQIDPEMPASGLDPMLLYPGGEGLYALIGRKDGGYTLVFFIGSPREDGTIQMQVQSGEKWENCIIEQKARFLIADDWITAQL